MRTTKIKMLILSFCMVLLGAVCAYSTMAYLYDEDRATNTFMVGSVKITLDEKDVDNSTANQERDQENTYHLLPGWSYQKDPTVHVEAGSEDCYVYVKVINGMEAYEESKNTITDQIRENGWNALEGVSNVYWKKYSKTDNETDFVVFKQLKISENANKVDGWSGIAAENDCKITVTAYAVQQRGFDNALDAWQHTFSKNQ